jgi:hypothetical protein
MGRRAAHGEAVVFVYAVEVRHHRGVRRGRDPFEEIHSLIRTHEIRATAFGYLPGKGKEERLRAERPDICL